MSAPRIRIRRLVKERLALLFDRFTLALIATVVLASIVPCRGQAASVFSLITMLAIALLFFMHGAKLSREAVIAGLTHWRLHLLVFLCTFALFPLLGVALQPLAVLMVGPQLTLGLLFLCAQSSIPDQFEFIQVLWSNFEQFLQPGTGLDAVIGQLPPSESREQAVEQPWPKVYGSHNQLDFSQQPPAPTSPFFPKRVGQWVTMRGGEYFFVPSLSALKGFGAVVEPAGKEA